MESCVGNLWLKIRIFDYVTIFGKFMLAPIFPLTF